MARRIQTTHDDHEAGFGLIEIVVSMFLLALVAMAFIPLIIQGIKLSARNTMIAEAAQLVSENIEHARSLGTSCASVSGFAALPIAPVTDARGVSLQVSRQADTCPTSATDYPTTVTMTVSVSQTGSSDVLARAVTRIFVASAS